MWDRVVCCSVIEHLLTYIKEQEKIVQNIFSRKIGRKKFTFRSLSNMRGHEERNSKRT